ncbi:MAG: nitroreductase family protein [Actinomycetota bacterium]
METWTAILSRRNIRAYEDRPIPDDALDQILEAGRRSPSSMNRQRWDFIVCVDRARLQRLATTWAGAGHVATSAATIALVAPESPSEDSLLEDSIQYDLGQVTMSMVLAATDLGIGCGHADVHDQDLAREILGLPPDRYCAYLIALGYSGERPLKPIRRPNRRPFDDVVHREQW